MNDTCDLCDQPITDERRKCEIRCDDCIDDDCPCAVHSENAVDAAMRLVRVEE